MTTDNCDLLICWIGTLDFRNEARSTDNVKSGDSEETFGVVDALRFVDLSTDWYGRIDLGFHKLSDDADG
jgi:hypothetical protein